MQLRDRIPQGRAGRGGGGGQLPPFWVSIRVQAGSPPSAPVYEAVVSPGYVEYQNINAADSVMGVTGYVVPSIGGVKIDVQLEDPDAEQPAIALTSMSNEIYLSIKTNEDGSLKSGISDCTIIVGTAESQSAHHIRPSPLAVEAEGEYLFLIAETEEVPGSSPARPRVKRRITGNRFMPNQLVEFINLSEDDLATAKEYEIYKGYDDVDDQHEFRAIKQVGTGSAVIRPAEGDYGDEINDKIKIRAIKEGPSPAQIKVTAEDEDDDIVIRGNSYDHTNTTGVKEITVVDGLVTSIVANDAAANLNLKVKGFIITTQAPYIESNSYERTYYWRNGLFVGSSYELTTPPGYTGALIEEEVAKIS